MEFTLLCGLSNSPTAVITEDGNPENRNYKSLAVYLHGVWSLMSRYFKNELPYSPKMIRQQIEKAGGKTYSKEKFHCDRDSSITYQRLKVNVRADSNGEIVIPKAPEMVTRSCVEIPIELVRERINCFESGFERDLQDGDGDSQNLVTVSSQANTASERQK